MGASYGGSIRGRIEKPCYFLLENALEIWGVCLYQVIGDNRFWPETTNVFICFLAMMEIGVGGEVSLSYRWCFDGDRKRGTVSKGKSCMAITGGD